jgi:hypothetical protein
MHKPFIHDCILQCVLLCVCGNMWAGIYHHIWLKCWSLVNTTG